MIHRKTTRESASLRISKSQWTSMGALLIPILLAPLPSSAQTKRKPESPNILIMMADDLGFSDLGCYGGEISTPHLDRLAAEGVKFSQFYNTAKCHSSRVSLLTGQYCLAAGNTSMSHAVTTAEVLAQNGYFTAMTGKWHLQQQPTDFGFERYFGHLSGACNYFTGDQTFRLNGEPWTVPSENFYTTVANVDYALEFLKTRGQPINLGISTSLSMHLTHPCTLYLRITKNTRVVTKRAGM